jgi:hypothetical protein
MKRRPARSKIIAVLLETLMAILHSLKKIVTFKDLLHAANLRHGTDGFISLPKEGVLRIFRP